MRALDKKLVTRADIHSVREQLRQQGKRVVFTNGCFDILHIGHVTYLSFARNQGDALIVGINSDRSVKASKGPSRPIHSEGERATVLAALECVDHVVVFDEDEPMTLIEEIIPDVLVKGEDWAHYVSGREVVEGNGGKVVLAPLVKDRSTSDTIERVLKTYTKNP